MDTWGGSLSHGPAAGCGKRGKHLKQAKTTPVSPHPWSPKTHSYPGPDVGLTEPGWSRGVQFSLGFARLPVIRGPGLAVTGRRRAGDRTGLSRQIFAPPKKANQGPPEPTLVGKGLK